MVLRPRGRGRVGRRPGLFVVRAARQCGANSRRGCDALRQATSRAWQEEETGNLCWGTRRNSRNSGKRLPHFPPPVPCTGDRSAQPVPKPCRLAEPSAPRRPEQGRAPQTRVTRLRSTRGLPVMHSRREVTLERLLCNFRRVLDRTRRATRRKRALSQPERGNGLSHIRPAHALPGWSMPR